MCVCLCVRLCVLSLRHFSSAVLSAALSGLSLLSLSLLSVLLPNRRQSDAVLRVRGSAVHGLGLASQAAKFPVSLWQRRPSRTENGEVGQGFPFRLSNQELAVSGGRRGSVLGCFFFVGALLAASAQRWCRLRGGHTLDAQQKQKLSSSDSEGQ